MVDIFGMVRGRKEKARELTPTSQMRTMGYDTIKQKALEKEKLRIVKSAATSAGKRSAFNEVYANQEKTKQRQAQLQKSTKVVGKVAKGSVKRFINVSEIQPPKRTKKSLVGLFNRSSFTSQTRR